MTQDKSISLPAIPEIKGSTTTHHKEEIFLNAFISFTKKGIADWERSQNAKEKDG
ncbi:hypothetical protein ACOI1C_20325 [Bacillus sp. DJP31]|uniref:hypothetical protein n=1 Tax=Bacillus sp. DJP31 TaxID=3409789 RepID=UPI003BB5303F